MRSRPEVRAGLESDKGIRLGAIRLAGLSWQIGSGMGSRAECQMIIFIQQIRGIVIVKKLGCLLNGLAKLLDKLLKL